MIKLLNLKLDLLQKYEAMLKDLLYEWYSVS